MPIEAIYQNGEDKMKKAIISLKKELLNIRTGRANPLILDKITVDYYGSLTPLRQMANVTVQDGQTLVIQSYDKAALKDMEKAILKSDLGVNPNNDGNNIRITFPPLTEDRRKVLAKDVKKHGEEGKVAIRNIRRDMTEALKKAEKTENIAEDEMKKHQDKVQKITDRYTKEVENIISEKEKEVLSV